MRVNAGFSRLLRLDGIWVRRVAFEADRVVVGVALRSAGFRRKKGPASRSGTFDEKPSREATPQTSRSTHDLLCKEQSARQSVTSCKTRVRHVNQSYF